MSMAGDIAEIATDVKWLVKRAEEDRQAAAARATEEEEKREALEARVTELEKGRIKTSAWAAGFGAAAAFAFSIVKDKLVAIILATLAAGCLTGCYATQPPGAEAYWHHWRRPVEVHIHEDTRPECVEATIEAVEFWKDKCGIDWLRPRVTSADWSGWLGHAAPFGTITVRDATVLPTRLGETLSNHFATHMRWARVRFSKDDPTDAVCTMHVAAHELGHALGLKDLRDADDQDRLMFGWYVNDMNEVSEVECDWVNQ